MNKGEFYTLTGYKLKEKQDLSNAMEDYIEMIYRLTKEKEEVHIKDLANSLNVRYSSVTKMMYRLQDKGLILFKNYSPIKLTESGKRLGFYLLYRHNVLVSFMKFLNKEDYQLSLVEKIEHFIDFKTIQNIESLLNSINNEQ